MQKFTDIKKVKRVFEDTNQKDELVKSNLPENIDKNIPNSESVGVVKLFSKLFESREMAHIYHLQSDKYGKHVALDDYYNSIGDLIDSIIESYQGKYGIIENYMEIRPNNFEEISPVEYFKTLADFIESERFNSIKKEDTFIHNIVDEILLILYRTLYKLNFLE